MLFFRPSLDLYILLGRLNTEVLDRSFEMKIGMEVAEENGMKFPGHFLETSRPIPYFSLIKTKIFHETSALNHTLKREREYSTFRFFE